MSAKQKTYKRPDSIPLDMWEDLSQWQKWFYTRSDDYHYQRRRKISDGMLKHWNGDA